MDTIRTARLELVPLSEAFVDALKRADFEAAEREIGARVSPWLMTEPAHFVQLHLAQGSADAFGIEGIGRAIVVVQAAAPRRAVGSIGFHGPPDDRSRLEVGCSIDPTVRHQGYAAEAMRGLVEWAVARYGIRRFVVSVPWVGEPSDRIPVEIGLGTSLTSETDLDPALALDRERPDQR